MKNHDDPLRFMEENADVPDSLKFAIRAASADEPSVAKLEAIATGCVAAWPTQPAARVALGAKGAAAGGGKLVLGMVGAVTVASFATWTAIRSIDRPAPPAAPASSAAPPAPAPVASEPSGQSDETGRDEAVEQPSTAVSREPVREAARPQSSASRRSIVERDSKPERAEAPNDPPPAAAPQAAQATAAAQPPRALAAPSEASLLLRARARVQSDPAGALELTRQHEQLFPNGQLVQEREAIAIEALERLGRVQEANVRAEAFDRKFPGSVHRRTITDGTR